MVGIKVYSFCSFDLYVRGGLQLVVSRGDGAARSTVFFVAGFTSLLLVAYLELKGLD
jgi:hypothetical protein